MSYSQRILQVTKVSGTQGHPWKNGIVQWTILLCASSGGGLIFSHAALCNDTQGNEGWKQMWRRPSPRCGLELTAPLSAPSLWWQCSGNCPAHPPRDLRPQELSSWAAPQPWHLLRHGKFTIYSVLIPRYYIQEAEITVNSYLSWSSKQSMKGKQKTPLVHMPCS